MENRTAPYGALLLRVALGAVLISHALLKLLVFMLPGAGAHSLDARREPV